jgi:Cu(I)/Ag(I) efflux system membrane fusion protein/cobalt-zinc-cadmium efflux system membrane fusion protein
MKREAMTIGISAVAALVLLAAGVWAGAMYHGQITGVLTWHAERAPASTATSATVTLYTCSMDPQVLLDHPGKCPICNMELVPVSTNGEASGGAKPERKILYWTDPTCNPPYNSDKPGKSPAGMDLLAVYDDEVSGGPAVVIDPAVVQNMGIRVARVTRGPLKTTLRVLGTLVEPEQNHVEINLRVSGWIQKLYANQEGMAVKKGDKLFDLYSTELTAAADDLINARKAAEANKASSDPVVRASGGAILDAARRKLELLGLGAADIDAMAALEKAPATVTFTSPLTGHVTEKMVVEGSSVKAGDRVMRIADRSTMWLQMQIYEYQLPLVHLGTPVRAQINGMPGKTYDGKIEFIYPHLDMMTRTAMVRITLPNEGHQLHEGMYATVEIDPQIAEAAVLVPREAVIDSGTRQIVFLAREGGHFEPRRVTVGQTGRSDSSDGDEMIQILSGLAGNEMVVTSGQFLLDSESRMEEAIQKHLRERLASIQAGRAQPASSALAAPPPNPKATAGEADDLFRAYLAVQTSLVGAERPVRAEALSSAAAAVASRLPAGEARDLANEIAEDARDLAGLPLDKQREAFKALSAAVIKLVGDAAPSARVAPALYEFHCPMAQADWLQAGDQTANPYITDMPTCGTLTRKIAPPGPETRP